MFKLIVLKSIDEYFKLSNLVLLYYNSDDKINNLS